MHHSLAITDGRERTNDTPLSHGPTKVNVLEVLGRGRAATARLVDASLPDGRTVRCVEKVFAPGLLTRFIYRSSFQSPFAYQSNRHAILASYFRRRVAAAVIKVSDIPADVALPLYVRFDREQKAWVLASQWIEGRGIRPAEPDRWRIRRRLGWVNHRCSAQPNRSEVQELVALMRRMETAFAQSGLIGSGWQVAPRALVSTANLLRVEDRYTAIDLESGIPAVLVPRYLLAGVRRGRLPPFDDLDPDQLRHWFSKNQALLTRQLGASQTAALCSDIDRLIRCSNAWKHSELALLCRPWRFFRRQSREGYRQELIRRWRQDEQIDSRTADQLPHQPLRMVMIWLVGLLPSALGRSGSRLLGDYEFRLHVRRLLRDRAYFATWWRRRRRRLVRRLDREGRVCRKSRRIRSLELPIHAVLRRLTPAGTHRFLTDPVRRAEARKRFVLLTFSPRYQRWFGRREVETAIDRWHAAGRLSENDRDRLYESLSGDEVRAYTRGFGMHLALKTMAPLIAPAKVGGITAFLASGKLWFLLPLLLTPLLRTIVTLTSAWNTRHDAIPHGEALLMGLLPTVGLLAFPLQMFSSRSDLSIFLIRDAASRLGKKIPVYGGSDSRTELALISLADFLIELLDIVSAAAKRVFGNEYSTERSSTRFDSATDRPSRTRLGRWIDRQAVAAIGAPKPTPSKPTITDDHITDDRRAA